MVHAAAQLLNQRLVVREVARLEQRAPGLGGAAVAALQDRISRSQPQLARSIAKATTGCWMPQEWELDRLDAFLTELRAAHSRQPGAAS